VLGVFLRGEAVAQEVAAAEEQKVQQARRERVIAVLSNYGPDTEIGKAVRAEIATAGGVSKEVLAYPDAFVVMYVDELTGEDPVSGRRHFHNNKVRTEEGRVVRYNHSMKKCTVDENDQPVEPCQTMVRRATVVLRSSPVRSLDPEDMQYLDRLFLTRVQNRLGGSVGMLLTTKMAVGGLVSNALSILFTPQAPGKCDNVDLPWMSVPADAEQFLIQNAVSWLESGGYLYTQEVEQASQILADLRRAKNGCFSNYEHGRRALGRGVFLLNQIIREPRKEQSSPQPADAQKSQEI